MSDSPKVFFIILNWNGWRDTLECLKSLAALSYTNFTILVVDNASTDESVSRLRQAHPEIEVLETKENLGFAGGNNVGIEIALKRGADTILLLNNDTKVDPHLLSAFVTCARAHPSAGILGAKAYLMDRPGQFDHFGGKWNPQTGSFDLIGQKIVDDGKSWETPFELDYACGCCLFIKREVFETIGLLEPSFFLFWEEADFCFRARRAGFKTLCAPQAKLWHKVSASFTGGKPHTTYFWWRGRLLWMKRNCPPSEKRALFLTLVLPGAFRLYKLWMIKSLQLRLFGWIGSQQRRLEKREKVRHYRAALSGIRDYFLSNWGNAPDWIVQK